MNDFEMCSLARIPGGCKPGKPLNVLPHDEKEKLMAKKKEEADVSSHPKSLTKTLTGEQIGEPLTGVVAEKGHPF